MAATVEGFTMMRASRQPENLALRQQLAVLKQSQTRVKIK
jgi:hypothetical protein